MSVEGHSDARTNSKEQFDVELHDRKDGKLRYKVRGNGLDGYFLTDPHTDEIDAGFVANSARSPTWQNEARSALRSHLSDVGPQVTPSDVECQVAEETMDVNISAGIAAYWSEAGMWPTEEDVESMANEK